MANKRIQKKRHKKFIASVAVLTMDQVDFEMRRPSLVDCMLCKVNIKAALKANGYEPLTNRRYKQEVQRTVKRTRFHNKWKP